MSGTKRFATLSKPASNAPATKLLKIKQDRQIAQRLLADPFAGIKVLRFDGVKDDAEPEVDLTEGACAALVMRWLSVRLAGRGDMGFGDRSLNDLGAMQAAYLKTIRAQTEPRANLEANRQALTALAAGCRLELTNLQVGLIRAEKFSPLDLRGFARDVTGVMKGQPLGACWILGFAMQRLAGPAGVHYPIHALGIFVSSETEGGQLSPLVVFDPNAGVYQIFADKELEFFDELERIYGDGSPVQLNVRAQVKPTA